MLIAVFTVSIISSTKSFFILIIELFKPRKEIKEVVERIIEKPIEKIIEKKVEVPKETKQKYNEIVIEVLPSQPNLQNRVYLNSVKVHLDSNYKGNTTEKNA